MTVEEIQENLLKVLVETLVNKAAVRENNSPFQNDPLGHARAVETIGHQVTAVRICCRAAGIDEDQIQNIISLCSL